MCGSSNYEGCKAINFLTRDRRTYLFILKSTTSHRIVHIPPQLNFDCSHHIALLLFPFRHPNNITALTCLCDGSALSGFAEISKQLVVVWSPTSFASSVSLGECREECYCRRLRSTKYENVSSSSGALTRLRLVPVTSLLGDGTSSCSFFCCYFCNSSSRSRSCEAEETGGERKKGKTGSLKGRKSTKRKRKGRTRKNAEDQPKDEDIVK